MAESTFLRWQDRNGDHLIDVCGEVPPSVKVCLECSPNPRAVVPNWRNNTIDEPFLNEKLCEYWITVETPFTDLNHMDLRVPPMKELAIDSLLDIYDKDTSEETRSTLRAALKFEQYDLEVRPNSHSKFLYAVPYKDLHDLPDWQGEQEAEPIEPEDVTVTYQASALKSKLVRIRKGLNLYSRFLKVYRGVEGGNIYYEDTTIDTPGLDAPGGNSRAIFNLEEYGDAGFFPGASKMGEMLRQLDQFLNGKGLNIPGSGPIVFFQDRVVKIEFLFSGTYDVKRMRVWTDECGEKPHWFHKKKLKTLLSRPGWRDRTARAYFAQLHQMETALSAREAWPWLEFVEKFTYPKVVAHKIPMNSNPEETVGSCIAESLSNEFKQLGQDIMDDVFGIGDAIAYLFHKNLCRQSLSDVILDDMEIGNAFDPDDPQATDRSKIAGMSTEQAFKSVDAGNGIGNLLCAHVLGAVAMPAGWCGSGAQQQMEILWKFGFDKLKICGFLDLMADALKCLLGGLTLEEALASILESALQAMGFENFGDLFIGLPLEEQAKLDILVKQKLSEGQIFKEGSQNALVSDGTAGNFVVDKPWENQDLIDMERESKVENGGEGMTATEMQDTSYPTRRTLGQQFDMGSASTQLDPNVVMQAYIKALLEYYSDNLLGLLDHLNKFPGAQLIAGFIAMIDCPRPPLFNPSIMDFLKDIELPFCRNMNDITLPRMENPFGWIPKLKDIWRWLWLALKCAIQQLIISILMKLMIKICELISSAICKALEVAGAMAASLFDKTTTFKDAIKGAICGEDADDALLDKTIEDMFNMLGSGGAALGNRERILGFSEDIASSVSQRELLEGFVGEPSVALVNITDTIIRWEYPDFREGLGGPDDIRRFFINVGNLLPTDFKEEIKDYLSTVPEDDLTPANPTLCATPQQLEDFKNLRCELLEGRATKEQCDVMYESIRGQFLDDLDTLNAVSHQGLPEYIMSNFPPIVSGADPNAPFGPECDDGLIPMEPEEVTQASSAALGNTLEQLKVEYSKDMLGNGPGERNWGMMNMILSDTMGNPFTAHKRKAFNSKNYVDFYVDLETNLSNFFTPDQSAFEKVGPMWKQEGAFPVRVGGWLQDYMADMSISFSGNNSIQGPIKTSISFEDLGFTGLFGGNINLLSVPDMGYNVSLNTDMQRERVYFTRETRKALPDIEFQFRDDAKGLTNANYSYGFDAGLYLSDLVNKSPTPKIHSTMDDPGSRNMGIAGGRGDTRLVWADNARIQIKEKFNLGVNLDYSMTAMMTDKERKEFEKEQEDKIVTDRLYEFVAIDDAFNDFEDIASQFPSFFSNFISYGTESPEVLLISDMIRNADADVALPTRSAIRSARNSFMEQVTQDFVNKVSANNDAFRYGAQFDPLSSSDLDYLTEDGVEYFDAQVEDEDGEMRPIRNSDMILGVSRNQLEKGEDARVIYLNPAQFGGSYMNPPLYIRPVKNKGWLGFVDVLFPDMSPCKPQRTDLIDFSDIQQKIDERYPTIPHDQRLKSDPDCIVEVPYNRILERSAKAQLEGIITVAIRSFVSVEVIKAMATFTMFNANCPKTYSKLFAAYIVEVMEAGFKDPSTAPWDFFSPFKDDEFWYGFLETAVQIYNYRVSIDEIIPPLSVQAALIKLDDMQEIYNYPDREDLRDAKSSRPRDAGMLETLKSYRESKNLEAVQKTEEMAKIVLTELVAEQVNWMGKKLEENLDIIGFGAEYMASEEYNNPKIYELDYYILENFTAGGEDLTLNQEGGDLKEEAVGLGEPGDTEVYTAGGSFSNADTGEEYIGYYHVFTDEEDGSTLFAAGEFPIDGEDPTLLRPVANKVIIPVGDVAPYGEATPSGSSVLSIEKYVSINGTRYSPEAARSMVTSHGSVNISDVYPGTMENTYIEGEISGIKGELGVRYGLQVSMIIGGQSFPLTTVEVDSLDLKCTQFDPFEGNSKLLYCLIKMLREDSKFKLVVNYVFPLPKIVSLIAVYNSIGLFPSIGEITAPDGDTVGRDGITYAGLGTKPGRGVTVQYERADGVVSDVKYQYTDTDGWASYKDRDPGLFGGWFVLEWDKWDQVLMRNTRSRLKRMFASFYRARDFQPGGHGDEPSAGTIWIQGLREAFRPPPGAGMLPWWRKSKLRSNPFNAEEQLCKKKD